MHTDIFSNCYKYKFVTKINPGTNNSVPELLYTFKSHKSGKTYYVHAEIHPNNFYGVKFHLKDHKNNPNKYNILTNLHEARTVIFTCISIMVEVNNNDPRSSFGFIGSNTTHLVRPDGCYQKMDEPKDETKRYNLYKRIMATFFDEKTFEHIYNEEYSAYMLVRQSELKENPTLINKINDYFSDQYTNFG